MPPIDVLKIVNKPPEIHTFTSPQKMSLANPRCGSQKHEFEGDLCWRPPSSYLEKGMTTFEYQYTLIFHRYITAEIGTRSVPQAISFFPFWN